MISSFTNAGSGLGGFELQSAHLQKSLKQRYAKSGFSLSTSLFPCKHPLGYYLICPLKEMEITLAKQDTCVSL